MALIDSWLYYSSFAVIGYQMFNKVDTESHGTISADQLERIGFRSFRNGEGAIQEALEQSAKRKKIGAWGEGTHVSEAQQEWKREGDEDPEEPGGLLGQCI